MNDYEIMIISALRYALPRKSYIMSVTDEYIQRMIKETVSKNFIEVCIQDIEYHYEESRRLSYLHTAQHDWKPLLSKLKEKNI